MGNNKSRFIIEALTALAGVFFFNHPAYAASYINVSSGSGGAISFGSVRPTSAGTSATASDKLTVNTNCNVGYSVYVSGQNGKDTNLTNSSASSDNVISASSNAIGSAGSLSSNTWGLNSENNGTYVGLPEYSETLPPALVTIPSASETSTVDIYYGLKVNTALTPGTYTGNVLYTVLSNSACSVYTVRFNANGGTGTMADQTINVGEATNLNMNTFTRSGYMFLGWATSSSAATPTYKDGESVADIANFNTTLNLYAVWGKSTGNMQDFVCTNLTSGTTTYLTDARDNQVYSVYRIPTDQTYAGTSTVANIAGKCLMTKDLSLGYVTGGSITRGSNLILSADTSAGETTSDAPIHARTDKSEWSGYSGDTNLQYINGPRPSYEVYSSHSYYSYGAAQKVCPRNWQLPAIAEYADNDLDGAPTMGLAGVVNNSETGVTALQSSPWDFMLGGFFYTTGWNAQGEQGGYWSSSQATTTGGWALNFESSNVYRYNNNRKSFGRSIRCIAEDDYTVNYSTTGAESGTPSKTSDGMVYESGSVTMPTVGSMVKSGYEFKGWALTSGASSATYAAGQTVTVATLLAAASAAGQTTTPGSTITLYPVWNVATYTYTLSYAGVDLATSNKPSTQTYTGTETSHTFTIPSATPASYVPLVFSNYTVLQGNATYSPGSTITLRSYSPSVILIANWTRSCTISSSTGCKLADNKTWIFGYNNSLISWSDMFTDAANTNNHDATVATSYNSVIICPSDYKAPKSTDYDALVQAYGGTSFRNNRSGYRVSTGALYKALGLSGHRDYWSSTEYTGSYAYVLQAYDDSANSSRAWAKDSPYYVLCYKPS